MQKNIVYLTVALFSIATEMRMMIQFPIKDSAQQQSRMHFKEELVKWSEIWHAQSVFFGSYYLPETCPLVTHVANSYNKHYIMSKQ